MKISHEVPLFLLDRSRKFNGYSYALVHLFSQYPEYYKFYVDELRNGREVILDNSVFELDKPFDAAEFANWVQRLVSDSGTRGTNLTYIIPDILDDGAATVQSAIDFIAKFPDLPGRKMSVAQGKTMLELQNCYRDLFPLVDKLGVSFNCKAYETWFENMQPGMPKLLQWVHGRQYFIETLFHAEWLSTEKPMHLLGIALPFEYSYYTHEHPELDDFIETADTSNPVAHGMLGIKYKDVIGLNDKQSIKLADMITAKEEDSHLDIIMYNVNKFREINYLAPIEE